MTAELWVTLLVGLAWPAFVAVLCVAYRRKLSTVVQEISDRIARGDRIETPWLTLGNSAGPLKKPSASELITDDHLALIHRSWRVPDRDAEFGGDEMYQIDVIVFGETAALDRIEYVTYRLDPAYPNPVRRGGPRETNFELKELANGYSQIRAEVKVKDQDALVHLSRFIDLMPESPPLKGQYLSRA
jgi:hypothetical protein